MDKFKTFLEGRKGEQPLHGRVLQNPMKGGYDGTIDGETKNFKTRKQALAWVDARAKVLYKGKDKK